MDRNLYKSKVTALVNKAKEKGLVKSYSAYCKTSNSDITKLTKDEIKHYTSCNKEK